MIDQEHVDFGDGDTDDSIDGEDGGNDDDAVGVDDVDGHDDGLGDASDHQDQDHDDEDGHDDDGNVDDVYDHDDGDDSTSFRVVGKQQDDYVHLVDDETGSGDEDGMIIIMIAAEHIGFVLTC